MHLPTKNRSLLIVSIVLSFTLVRLIFGCALAQGDSYLPDKSDYGLADNPFHDKNNAPLPPNKIWDAFNLDHQSSDKRAKILALFRSMGIIVVKGNAYNAPYDEFITGRLNFLYDRDRSSLLSELLELPDPKYPIFLKYIKLCIPAVQHEKSFRLLQSEALLYRYGDADGEHYFDNLLNNYVAKFGKEDSPPPPASDDDISEDYALMLFALDHRVDYYNDLLTAMTKGDDTGIISPLLEWHSPLVNSQIDALWPQLPPSFKSDPDVIVCFAGTGNKEVLKSAEEYFFSGPLTGDRAVGGLAVLKLSGPTRSGYIESIVLKTLAGMYNTGFPGSIASRDELIVDIGILNQTQYAPELISVIDRAVNSEGDNNVNDIGPYNAPSLAAETLCQMKVSSAETPILKLIKRMIPTGNREYIYRVSETFIRAFGATPALEAVLPGPAYQDIVAKCRLKPIQQDLEVLPVLACLELNN